MAEARGRRGPQEPRRPKALRRGDAWQGTRGPIASTEPSAPFADSAKGQPGLCASVFKGEGQHCRTGNQKGMWRLPDELDVSALALCLLRCAKCAQCSFISLDRARTTCFWFAACDTDRMIAGARHETWRVRLSNGSLTSATARQLPPSDLPANGRRPQYLGRGSCGVMLQAAGEPGYVEEAEETVRRLLFNYGGLPAGCRSMNITLLVDDQQVLLAGRRRALTAISPLAVGGYPSAAAVNATDAQCGSGGPSWAACSSIRGGRIGHIKPLGLLRSPYDVTLYLDLDAWPCRGWEKLLEHVSTTDADVAAAVDITPFGSTAGNRLLPGPSSVEGVALDSWARFPERNAGVLVLRTRRAAVRALLRSWLYHFAEAKSSPFTIRGDQYAFRRSLFGVRGRLALRMIPHTQHCRRHDATPCVGECRVRHGKAPGLYKVTPHLAPSHSEHCTTWACAAHARPVAPQAPGASNSSGLWVEGTLDTRSTAWPPAGSVPASATFEGWPSFNCTQDFALSGRRLCCPYWDVYTWDRPHKPSSVFCRQCHTFAWEHCNDIPRHSKCATACKGFL